MPLTHHEDPHALPPLVLEQRRALESVIEELEAVAWYNERAAASRDPELTAILEHNRDEEIEHAVMALEWLRRNFPKFDDEMKTYFFTNQPVTQVEELAEAAENPATSETPQAAYPSLNIGSIRKKGE